MTWKKNPASMGGGGDFPREFGMWFGGAGRAGHPATSRGASILKKSKEKELVGKERKKVIAKLSKQLAAKERLYRDNKGNLVRGKDRKKDSKKTHDTLGRKIRRGSERKSPKSLPHVKARTKAAKKAQLDRRAEHIKEVKRLEKVKDDKRMADSFKRVEAKIKVQKIPEGKSSSQAEATGKKITTKEEAKRIRDYIKTQKMLDDYTN